MIKFPCSARKWLPSISLGGLLLFAVGCGNAAVERVPVHPVQGKVSFQGKPTPGAIVALHPKQASDLKAPSPRGLVKDDGTFSLTTYSGSDGAPEGEYVVTVQWYKLIKNGKDAAPGPNVLPRKYELANTSNLTVRVAAGDNQLDPIQLR